MKHNSIYYRFLKLLLIALTAAALFFLLLHQGVNLLLQSYFTKTNYAEQENDRRIQEFKNYVTKNHLAASDTTELTRWVMDQSVVWVQIYQNQELVYDSQYPYMDSTAEYHVDETYYDWDSYVQVDFADGEAEVFLTGMYTYQFFNYALIIEFFLSFLLFTGTIMAGIHKTMRYIRTLSTEIEILEGGDLDYRITITGNDELAVLARGLDSMRQSIRSQMKQEAELIRLNQSMISSLSHDLRTPLTALLIYTEILKNGIDDGSRAQTLKLVTKIDDKAHQIKEMADCILEYSLNKKTVTEYCAGRQSFRSAFYDPLSETCACLEQRGCQVQADLTWEAREVCVDVKYITRILDNITSNILKYASTETPIHIAAFYDDAHCGLVFENARRTEASQVESTRIGLQNIRLMMEEMGGSCEVTETEETYELRLAFPTVS